MSIKGLMKSMITYNSISLSWNHTDIALSYQVEYFMISMNTMELIKNYVNTTNNNVILTSLQEDSAYAINVKVLQLNQTQLMPLTNRVELLMLTVKSDDIIVKTKRNNNII